MELKADQMYTLLNFDKHDLQWIFHYTQINAGN